MPRLNRRGSILFLTLMFLVLINLFAVAFWKLVPVELHSAKRHQLETEAYFASDAGVAEALAWLEYTAGEGNIDNFFNNNGTVNPDGHLTVTRTGQMGTWTWETEIIPGPETFGNNGGLTPNPLRVYQIRSVARRPGSLTGNEQYREIHAWVRQRSFTDFNWGNMATAGQDLWLFMDTFRLGGDYHTNGKGLLQINNGNFWSNSTAAIGGDFTFVQGVNNPSLNRFVDGIQYSAWGADNVPYWTSGGQAGDPRGNRYEKITAGGRAGVRQTDAVEMPLNTDSIAFGVWGNTPPTTSLTNADKIFGASSVVSAKINGATPGGAATNGIWIDGNVNQIEFRTNTNTASDDPVDDNQIIRVYQGTNANRYLEITHVTGRNYTIPTGYAVEGGTHANGAVLSPNDNGGKGYTVIRNVTDQAANRKLVVYADQTNGAIYSTGDVLGVRGIVKGRRSVGVSTDTGNATAKDRTIRINGELLYAGVNRGDVPDSTDNTLGLIGYAVRMRDTAASAAPTDAQPQLGLMWPTRQSRTVANPHYLYCSIFAGRRNDPMRNASGNTPTLSGGGFGSMSPDTSGLGQGHMVLFGSITEGIRQWKGTGTTGGNTYAFHIDPNLKVAQPPFFPTLPKFDMLTWEEKSVFSY